MKPSIRRPEIQGRVDAPEFAFSWRNWIEVRALRIPDAVHLVEVIDLTSYAFTSSGRVATRYEKNRKSLPLDAIHYSSKALDQNCQHGLILLHHKRCRLERVVSEKHSMGIAAGV